MGLGDHDKTEKPTPKRRREARHRGQVARSPEIPMWLSLLIASFVLPKLVSGAATNVRRLEMQSLAIAGRPDPNSAVHLLGRGLATAALSVVPLLLTLVVVAIVANVAQTGLAINRKAFKLNASKLNIVKGFKQLLSPAGMLNALKSLLKVALVAGVAWSSLRSLAVALVQPGVVPLSHVVGMVAKRGLSFIRTVASVGLLLGLADFAVQKRRISKQLRMSKQEIKDEMKEADGNPQVKGAMRRLQSRMSRLRMLAEVANADVVVVNPTHVAVALRYRPGTGAPRLVAKGADEVAARIREEAERNRVPMVEDVPLARTLWAVCEPGDEIPADLFEAVARLLAFIFTVKRAGLARPIGGGPLKVPVPLLR